MRKSNTDDFYKNLDERENMLSAFKKKEIKNV